MAKSHTQLLVTEAPAEHLPHLQKMGRRARRAAETRVRLFRSAMELFADRGFFQVTVEDITEAADVGKGTFFNYFDSKEQVLGVMAEIQLGKVREARAQAEAGKHPIRSVLRQLFQRIAEEPGRSPALARALISIFLTSGPVREQVAEGMKEGRRLLAEIFELGRLRDEIPLRFKPAQLALSYQQAVLGTLLVWTVRGDADLHTALAESFQHFWRGVMADKGSKR